MSDPIRVVLVGVGGYGEEYYLPPLLAEEKAKGFCLVGVVDPYPERCGALHELQALKIPFFRSLEEFFGKETCDLVILASPLHVHCSQTCLALAHGSHVLCEKPLCVTPEQIQKMEEAEKISGKTVTIGYQWSFSPAVQRLKADILGGRLGAPVRFRTLVGWPRNEAYYQRNQWAGRQRSPEGEAIFDSPVNNATAHFLHNMLYLLGPEVSKSAVPTKVEASLWRANPIENYDTAALRVDLGMGIDVLFYTSHAVEHEQGPIISYEFERGTVEYEPGHGHLIAKLEDGETIDYGSPDGTPHQKIWAALDSVRTGSPSICGIAAASAHVRCVCLAQESPRGIQNFPPALVHVHPSETSPRRYVSGLLEAMNRCYREGKLFGEVEDAFWKSIASAA